MKNTILDDMLEKELMSEDLNIIKNTFSQNSFEEDYQLDLTEMYPLMPIEWIKPRPVNDYMKSKIKQLAEGIRKVGLLNPILVYASNDDQFKYTISDGERRYRAVKMLYEEALENNDYDEMEKWKLIRVHILTDDEIKHEESIHRMSNDLQREQSTYELIYRYYPTEDTLKIQENIVEYANLLEEDGYNKYLNNELKIKFNNTDLYNYIYLKFKRDHPDSEISVNVVKKYVISILSSTDELKQAVLETKVFPKDAIKIARLPREEQIEIIKRINDGELLKDILKNNNSNIETEKQVKEYTDSELIISVGKNFIKTLDSKDKILNINTKGMTGNQVFYIKKLKQIYKQIEDLKDMPIK